LVLLIVAFMLLISGCGPRLEPPTVLAAPYEQPMLWGVAPFANESGVSVVDTARVADAFTAEAQQVRGVNTVPVNRVIAAMRELDMAAITSRADALTIMNLLALDGLIVGTVTAYDPYRPMTLGLAVELYSSPRILQTDLDPRALAERTSGEPSPGELGPRFPVAAAAGVFDAGNHATLMQLEAYAAGRSEPESAYGDDIYLVSMDLYTKFACHRLLHDLLANERARLTAVTEPEP
jgi:hypothetical protein